MGMKFYSVKPPCDGAGTRELEKKRWAIYIFVDIRAVALVALV